jgi:hypothetical protein
MLGGCGSSSGSSCNGVTIPSSDGTPPTLTFGLAPMGSAATTTVSTGGMPQTATLPKKTGSLNLLVTAKDSESGLHDVQIWMTKTTTRCSGGICTQSGPGLVGAPIFSNPDSGKNTGDCVAESSTLAEAVDLSTEIPQAAPASGASLVVSLDFWAVGINHLGQKEVTPTATMTWSEATP